MRRVLNHKFGRRWRASVPLRKRSKRFGVGKETKGGKRRYRQRKANRERTAPARAYVDPDAINGSSSKYSEEGRDYLSLELADCLNARFTKRGNRAGGIGSFLMRCGCQNRLRIAPDCRAQTKREGFGEDGNAHPRRTANKGRADAGEDLTPSR